MRRDAIGVEPIFSRRQIAQGFFGGEGFGDEAGVEDFGVEGGEEAGEGGFGEEDITNEEGDFEIPEEPATAEE